MKKIIDYRQKYPHATSRAYNVSAIMEMKNRMVDVLQVRFTKRPLRGKLMKEFVRVVAELLNVSETVIADSMHSVQGETLDKIRLDALCHRFCGNEASLKRGEPLMPWTPYVHGEWVPVQIMSVSPRRNTKGSSGAQLQLKILAGSAAGTIIFAWWSILRCRFHATKHLGFSKRSFNPDKMPPFPYRDPRQLVTLRFKAIIDPERTEDTPVLGGLEVSGQLLKWNKHRIALRKRNPKVFVCPNKYPLTLLCHQCPIGYLDCEAGCHRETYEVKHCDTCNKNGFFDDDPREKSCLRCRRKVF